MYDESNLRNFRKSYPSKDPDLQAKYEHFLDEAKVLFNEFTTHSRPAADGQF